MRTLTYNLDLDSPSEQSKEFVYFGDDVEVSVAVFAAGQLQDISGDTLRLALKDQTGTELIVATVVADALTFSDYKTGSYHATFLLASFYTRDLTAGAYAIAFKLTGSTTSNFPPLGISVYDPLLTADMILCPSIHLNLEIVSGTAMTLTWDNFGGNVGYNIESSSDNITFVSEANLATDVTTYADTGLASVRKYYRARPITTPVSAWSGVVSGIPGGGGVGGGGSLGVVGSFAAASGGTTSVDLTWTDSTDESYYIIERSTDSGSTYVRHTTVAGGATSYTDTGLTPLTRYDYRVTAFDDLDVSTAWAEANTTTDAPTAPQTGLVSHYKGEDFNTGTDEWPDVNTASSEMVRTSGSAASLDTNWEGTGKTAVVLPAGAKYEFQLPSAYSGLGPGTATSDRCSLYCVFLSDETGGFEVLRMHDGAVPADKLYIRATAAELMGVVSDRGVGADSLDDGTYVPGEIAAYGFSRGLNASGTIATVQLDNNASVSGTLDATGSDAANLDTIIIGFDGTAIEIAEILFYDGDTVILDATHHALVMQYLTIEHGI
jgi:hypothetical protein